MTPRRHLEPEAVSLRPRLNMYVTPVEKAPEPKDSEVLDQQTVASIPSTSRSI